MLTKKKIFTRNYVSIASIYGQFNSTKVTDLNFVSQKFDLDFITDVFIVDNEIFLGCESIGSIFVAFKVEHSDFYFIKSINSKFNKFSYIFRGANGLKFVMWD